MSKRYMKLSSRTISARMALAGEFLSAAFRSVIFPQEYAPFDFKGSKVGDFPACSLADSLTLSTCALVMLFKGTIELSVSSGEIQWLDSPAPVGGKAAS